MSHPNSHSGQIVSIKNATKGALNIRGEAIAFFHLPPESLSSQEAESLDQESKEVPRGKMKVLSKERHGMCILCLHKSTYVLFYNILNQGDNT
jgi:hypothetical protein